MSEKEFPKASRPLLADDTLYDIAAQVLDSSLNGYVLLPDPPGPELQTITKRELTALKAENTIPKVTLIPTSRWLAYTLAKALNPKDPVTEPYLAYATLNHDPLNEFDIAWLCTLVENNDTSIKAEIQAGLRVSSYLSRADFERRYLTLQPDYALAAKSYSYADIIKPALKAEEVSTPAVHSSAAVTTPKLQLARSSARISEEYKQRFDQLWKTFKEIGYVLDWDRTWKWPEVFMDQSYTLKNLDIQMLNDTSYGLVERASRVMGLLMAMGRVVKAHEGEYLSAVVDQRVASPVDCRKFREDIATLHLDIVTNTPDPYDRKTKTPSRTRS